MEAIRPASMSNASDKSSGATAGNSEQYSQSPAVEEEKVKAHIKAILRKLKKRHQRES